MKLRLASLLLSSFVLAACALDVRDRDDEEPGEEDVGTTESALSASDPVSAAVTQSCSTTAVKGLSTQLVEEILCLKPGSMKKISGTSGLSLGAAVFPYLQTPAANALVSAQKARGVTMKINSGLRTLPQQYLLFRWYQTGRCGIALAAQPGRSNHESGIAVDIADNAAWRSAMTSKGFRWLGASDPVHFDFIGGGTFDMRGLSVKAFQRLWNRNNPNDEIEEDGIYGPITAARLAKSPVGGFPIGAQCNRSGHNEMSVTDAPQEDEPEIVPDATEPEEDAPPSHDTASATLDVASEPSAAEAGCSTARTGRTTSFTPALVAAAMLVLVRRRRRA